MRPRENPHLARDGANVLQAAPIDAPPFFNDGAAHHLALDVLAKIADVLALVRVGRRQRRRGVRFGLRDGSSARLLRRHLERRREARPCLRRHRARKRLVAARRRHRPLRPPERLAQLLLQVQQRLQRLVCRKQRVEQDVFRQPSGAPLDHHDAVPAAGHDEVKVRLLYLGDSRVNHELPTDAADPHRRDRSMKRDIGHVQRRRRPGHRQHVGVVLPVVRQHRGNHLRFAGKAVRKQRADRSIDEPRRQRLAFRRSPLALEEAAGNLSGGEGALLVVASERKEIDALATALRCHRGDQHQRLAEGHQHGPIGLLGHPPHLEGEATAMELRLDLTVHGKINLPGSRPLWGGKDRWGPPPVRRAGYLRIPNRPIRFL